MHWLKQHDGDCCAGPFQMHGRAMTRVDVAAIVRLLLSRCRLCCCCLVVVCVAVAVDNAAVVVVVAVAVAVAVVVYKSLFRINLFPSECRPKYTYLQVPIVPL